MKTYLLKETIEPCRPDELQQGGCQYVAVLSPAEWKKEKARFNMGIEMEPDAGDIHSTKAEVNYASMTGTFSVPDRRDISGPNARFAFALDEKGVVFIDEGDTAVSLIDEIGKSKRWRRPCLERFLYDFLEQIVHEDLSLMEGYEHRLDELEDLILDEKESGELAEVNRIRSDMRELRVHYEQLIDMTQELEENENGFFNDEDLRYIHLFMNRMLRLHDTADALWEHTIQVRDLYHTQLEVRQNRIMTLLTVVTTIFMPLTLIAGWYGMNFRYMPELEMRYGYLAVIVLSIVIVIVSLVFFKKKKWL